MRCLIEIVTIPVPKLVACKDCIHAQKWECNSKYFYYCGVAKSNRTENGLKKIKLKEKRVCDLFEKEKNARTN